jgi:hypothetical protein
MSECNRATLRKALQDLVRRLDEVHADEHYKSVWVSYMIHGGDYSRGLKYDGQLEAARAALSSPPCQIEDRAIERCDDGSSVHLASYTGGAHPAGLWGELELAFESSDGQSTLRRYVREERVESAERAECAAVNRSVQEQMNCDSATQTVKELQRELGLKQSEIDALKTRLEHYEPL